MSLEVVKEELRGRRGVEIDVEDILDLAMFGHVDDECLL